MGSLPSGVSGSRAAAILGLNPYKTPLGVWLDIMEQRQPGYSEIHGLLYEPFEGNVQTEWGLAFENAVIDLAQESPQSQGKPWRPIIDRECEFRHPVHGYLTCHVDGIYTSEEPGSVFKEDLSVATLHEGKTTTIFSLRDRWGEPGSDRIPEEYQVQVQHQLLVTGAKNAIVSVLAFPERQTTWDEMGIDPDDVASRWAPILAEMGYFKQYFIEADKETHEALIMAEVDFWENNVLEGVPPDPENYADIRKLFTAPKGTIVASETLERWSAEYRLINDESAKTNKRKDQLKTLMLAEMAKVADVPIDDDSQEKWILMSRQGKKLHQYDGKKFR